MKAPLLAALAASLLLAACSDKPAQTAKAPPSLDEAKPAVPPAARNHEPVQGDLAAAEAGPRPEDSPPQAANGHPSTGGPCDLTGYDMSKMTVDQHESLVKQCEQWKAQQPE